MFGKLGDMGGMLKKAMEIKKEVGRIKEELETEVVKGICEDSVVIEITGAMNVNSVNIAPECFNSCKIQEIEEKLKIAINNAIKEAQTLSQTKLAAVTGGLNIPGLFD